MGARSISLICSILIVAETATAERHVIDLPELRSIFVPGQIYEQLETTIDVSDLPGTVTAASMRFVGRAQDGVWTCWVQPSPEIPHPAGVIAWLRSACPDGASSWVAADWLTAGQVDVVLPFEWSQDPGDSCAPGWEFLQDGPATVRLGGLPLVTDYDYWCGMSVPYMLELDAVQLLLEVTTEVPVAGTSWSAVKATYRR